MTALPSATDFTSPTATEGQFKTALNAQRDFLAGLLGVDGTAATALGQLGALMASAVGRTTATTLTTTDRGRLFTCTGTWALTLPTAAVAGAGWTVAVANLGTGTITVTPSGGDLVDGAATVALAAGRAALLCATATGWMTFAFAGQVGQTLIPGGTVALPGLAFPGDTNTGLYRPGGDKLAFTTGGVERARVTTAGMQVTGLISGTAVTQSATDTTAGRITKVGDFGIGSSDLPYVADYTVALSSGLYRGTGASVGAPVPSGFPTWNLIASAYPPMTNMLSFKPSLSAASLILSQRSAETGPFIHYWAPLQNANGDVLFGENGQANMFVSRVTIADDAVATLTVGRAAGVLTVTCGAAASSQGLPQYSGEVWIATYGTRYAIESTAWAGVGANFNTAVTDLTGTTGTDGNVTVAAVSSGVIKIENRSGASRNFIVVLR